MMTQLQSQMDAMLGRVNTRLDKVTAARSRPSSSIPPTPPTPQSDPPSAVTQQTSHQKQKRNERTRQQYKRKKAMRATVQQEMEHSVQQEVEHTERESSEHVVLLRIESVPWDEATTSWCWHAVITAKIGRSIFERIGTIQTRSRSSYLGAAFIQFLIHQLATHHIPGIQWESQQPLALHLRFSQHALIS